MTIDNEVAALQKNVENIEHSIMVNTGIAILSGIATIIESVTYGMHVGQTMFKYYQHGFLDLIYANPLVSLPMVMAFGTNTLYYAFQAGMKAQKLGTAEAQLEQLMKK